MTTSLSIGGGQVPSMDFIGVHSATDKDSNYGDGILGLCAGHPNSGSVLILDKMKESGLITSRVFGADY